MRRGLIVAFWGFAVSLALLPSVARAADFVPGEVIVGFEKDRIRPAAVESLPGVEGSERVGGMGDVKVLDLEPGESVTGAVESLEARPGVAYAQPNWIFHLKSLPNDPMFGQLWGLRNAGQDVTGLPDAPVFGVRAIDSGAYRAWKQRTGGTRAVGVIDSGISKEHPDLKRNIDWKLSRNFAPFYPGGTVDPKAWDDPHGHGTHVAGTIGAVGNNGLGVVGVNWRTRLVALRACTAEPDCASADMAAAIDYAGRKGIAVVNMSLGSEPGDPWAKDRVVIDALRRHPRTLLVNAAGNETNDDDRTKVWPCSSGVKNMLCVAALDPRGKLAYFSNWGRRTVDLGAPGQYITSTWANKVFPLDAVFFRDGLAGWEDDGWQEAEVDDLLVLRYAGSAPTAWAGPSRDLDLRGMRHCRATVSLAGHLSGNQTVTVQYRLGGGPWIDSVKVAKAGSVGDEERDLFFFIGGAAGSEKVNVRVLYRSGGTTVPAPRLDMSSAEVACIAKMPPGGVYRQLEGTSMASPHVAGVAALVRSVYPRLRGVRLKRLLLSTVVKTKSLRGKTVSGGRVNAARALRKARKMKLRSRRR